MKVALVAVFISLRLLPCLTQCNGAIEYCDLPLSRFTFPGAHNSGSSGLSMPLGLTNLSCMFANQDLSVTAQLNAGVRYLDTDICVEAGAPNVLYNCNGLKSNETLVAYGKTISSSLRSIKAFLHFQPNEVVIFGPSDINVPQGVTNSNVQQLLESEASSVFGAHCVDLNATTVLGSAPNGLGCAFLRTYPSDNVTLGKIVSSDYRVIFLTVASPVLTSTYTSAYQGIGATAVGALLENFASSLSNNTKMLTTFQASRTQNASLQAFAQCSGAACSSLLAKNNSILSSIQQHCFSAMAVNSNPVLSPSCAALPLHSVPCPSLGCDCQPVRSETEVAHRIMLSKGNSVLAVLVDYVDIGGLLDTVQRMNAAHLCNFKGPSYLKSSGASVSCGNMSKVVKNRGAGQSTTLVPRSSTKSLRGGHLLGNSSKSLPGLGAPVEADAFNKMTVNISHGAQLLGSQAGSAGKQASSNISKSGWTSGAFDLCLGKGPVLILLSVLLSSAF